MNYPPYPFTRFADRYIFISTGKTNIPKVVEFTLLKVKSLFNLSFGDILPDGTIDDKVNSNNGDIARVLATVIKILIDFLETHPYSNVFFAGSTDSRTALYSRILKVYYSDFTSKFIITAFIMQNGNLIEIEFDPEKTHYYGFLIRRK